MRVQATRLYADGFLTSARRESATFASVPADCGCNANLGALAKSDFVPVSLFLALHVRRGGPVILTSPSISFNHMCGQLAESLSDAFKDWIVLVFVCDTQGCSLEGGA